MRNSALNNAGTNIAVSRRSFTHRFITFFYNIFSSKIVFPLLLFIWFLVITWAKSPKNKGSPSSLRGDKNKVASFNPEKLKGDEEFHVAPPTHLIVVAGHAVMRLSNMKIAAKSDDGWYLLPYQRNIGFPAIICAHIKAGISLAKSDASNSILVFSGGQTRRDVGPLSEAASYYYLASENKWIEPKSNMVNNIYLEEYARDSFENLLFSICRFREVVGYYPKSITVVGFDFKGKRFSEFHRKALGFPESNFTYIGLQSSEQSPKFSVENQRRALTGESAALASFTTDLYGCNNPELRDKRNLRNPFRRTIPYSLACPEIKELLAWCGPDLFKDLNYLPWSNYSVFNGIAPTT